MNCPQCGHSNPVDLIACESCGDLLVDVFASPQEGAGAEAGSAAQGERSRADAASVSPSAGGVQHLTTGSVLGHRYDILELIGEGGMGRVYKVHDKELDKIVALKLIRKDQAADPIALQRFKQELLLARQITHKNVVRIYDFGEAGGLKFFTMEWIDGEHLKAVTRRRGRLPMEEAIQLIRPMLEALEEAHRQGVVHRDLKPHNVMIDREGCPHIMDFGIARATDTSALTATGAVMGTPDYMSPEQACGEKTDRQSDLYSFGIILYELLTGELPFQADSPLSRVVMRVTKKPAPPRQLNVELPSYLEKIVLKCLEVDKDLRYQSAREILEDLDREHVETPILPRLRKHMVRHHRALAAAAVTALSMVVGLVVMDRLGRAPAGAPETVLSLAILPLTNASAANEVEWLRTGLPEMLYTDISQSRYVRPVPGERVMKLLREMGVAGNSRFDEATVNALAQRAPADWVLYGQFVEAQGRIRLDLHLRNAASGVPAPIKVEKAKDDIFSLVDQVTQQIKEQLDLSPDELKGDTDQPVVEVTSASVEALRAYHAGLAHLRSGSNQQALPLLERAVSADPDFAMAYAMLAQAHLNLGEYEKAAAAVEKASSLADNAPLPLVERYQIHAITALTEDDYETAAKSYAELADLFPEDPDIKLSLAQSYEGLGLWSKAEEAYQGVVELAPDYGAALLGLGRVQVLAGRYGQAIESLQRALDTDQFSKDLEALGMIHSIMGVAYRETGQLDDAIEHLSRSHDYRKRTGNKRGQAVSLTHLAAVYEFRGQVEKALEAERKAVALAREIGDRSVESQALLNMGLTFRAAGRMRDALEALQQSMRIEREREDHADLAIRLDAIAEIYLTQGQHDLALVFLEQAKGYLGATGDPQERGNNRSFLGQVKMSLGETAEAQAALLEALGSYQQADLPRGVAETQVHLAELYSLQGRYADAQGALVRALETLEKTKTVRDIASSRAHMARFLLSVGQLEEAVRELGAAREATTTGQSADLEPLLLLCECEQERKAGHWTRAVERCRSAQDEARRLGKRELAFRAVAESGRALLAQGHPAEAERVLSALRRELTGTQLRVLEAETLVSLAQAHLARGDEDAARREALDALDLAKRFSGRPLLMKAHAVLAAALEGLSRTEQAAEAYGEVSQDLSWIIGSLPEAHRGAYVAQGEVQTLLRDTATGLKKAGRKAQADALQKWISTKPSAP